MLIIKIILSLIVSIVICKLIALLEIVLSLFVYSKIKSMSLKESDDLIKSLNERTLLVATIIVYVISAVLSTACMFGLLNLCGVGFAVQISIAWLAIRSIITYFRFKSKWKSYIIDKIKLIQNKKIKSLYK